jgi:hypothetical protein
MTKRTRVATRPARTAALVTASILSLGAVGGLGWWGIDTVTHSKEGRASEGISASPAVPLPKTPAYLVAAIDRTGKPASLMVLAPRPEGADAIVLVPTTARVDTRDPKRPTRLVDTYVDDKTSSRGAIGQLSDATATYLGIEFDESFGLTGSAQEDFFAALGPVTFRLDADVTDTDASGAAKVLWPAGPVTLRGAEVAAFVTARITGEPESVRLARLADFWTAAVAPNPARAAGNPEAPGAAGALARVLAGTPTVRTLAGAPLVDPELNPQKLEMIGVDIAGLRLLMAEVLPGAVSFVDNGLKFEIRDPFKNAAVRRELVGRLTFLYANIVYVHEVDDQPTVETLLYYDNPAKRRGVDFYAPNLGTTVIAETEEAIERIDVVLTIGQELYDSIVRDLGPAATSTTAGRSGANVSSVPTTVQS